MDRSEFYGRLFVLSRLKMNKKRLIISRYRRMHATTTSSYPSCVVISHVSKTMYKLKITAPNREKMKPALHPRSIFRMLHRTRIKRATNKAPSSLERKRKNMHIVIGSEKD